MTDEGITNAKAVWDTVRKISEEREKELFLRLTERVGIAPTKETPSESTRARILDTAKQYVTQDRQATHGKPEDTFGRIAALWSAYLDIEIGSHEVCSMMSLLKIARAQANPFNEDNWVDLAGYAACGGELAK